MATGRPRQLQRRERAECESGRGVVHPHPRSFRDDEEGPHDTDVARRPVRSCQIVETVVGTTVFAEDAPLLESPL